MTLRLGQLDGMYNRRDMLAARLFGGFAVSLHQGWIVPAFHFIHIQAVAGVGHPLEAF